MNFIEGLSKSEDEDTTLIMVDRFTKYIDISLLFLIFQQLKMW
jgi:hypothetical protein